MLVLIAKQNERIIRNYLPDIKFTENSKNTTNFFVSQSQFKKLYEQVKQEGYNPYALMNW